MGQPQFFLALGFFGDAVAQTFPAKPVRSVAPYSPGSGPDAVMRILSERLSRMVLGHMAGDQDAVKRELDEIVAKHVKVVQKPQGGLH